MVTAIVMVDEEDPTPEPLVAELRRRGAAVARLDPARFPDQLTVAAELDDDAWTGSFGCDDPGSCLIDDGHADLSDVTGVLYRRPRGYECSLGLFVQGTDMRRTAQARLGFGGLFCAVGSWANHPQRSGHAEYVPVQMRTARELGLPVPRTCVTNDPATAHRFVTDVGRVLRKPFRGHEVGDGFGGRTSPSFVSLTECDERVRTTAHLFQEWIDADHTVRLTVVDGRVFAARTEFGPGSPNYRPLLVAPPIRDIATEFVHRFGLRFAALDFAVDPAGRWWFIGCDPNPCWTHVEERAGLPITAALADALLGSRDGREPVGAVALSASGPLPGS